MSNLTHIERIVDHLTCALALIEDLQGLHTYERVSTEAILKRFESVREAQLQTKKGYNEPSKI